MNLGDTPKQFLPLADKPMIIHTLDKFCLCGEFDAIYVGVHQDWTDYTQSLLGKYHLGEACPIKVVAGGETRNDTILNTLQAIEADYGVADDHLVVSHDAARPFVSLRTIKANIACVQGGSACDTVIAAADTIVHSNLSGDAIVDIPDRAQMFQGQTPQSFRIKDFEASYAALSDVQKAGLTDACKVLLAAGLPVKLVRGDSSNIKLTTAMDYKLAQMMIAVHESDVNDEAGD
jgi:2-C-methyl-D-erythritol 4-phosphate cytidylyltransferase